MSIELIRLYDWDPRNSHEDFLDACKNLGIGVLVSVSNYNLRPDQGLPRMKEAIPALIRSFSNKHQAITPLSRGSSSATSTIGKII